MLLDKRMRRIAFQIYEFSKLRILVEILSKMISRLLYDEEKKVIFFVEKEEDMEIAYEWVFSVCEVSDVTANVNDVW